MSQELKTKFTADASDFNGAVKQIEGKLKGVGKLGQGFGVGNVTGGVGNILGGLGGLGMVGGGAAGGVFALTKAAQLLNDRLDERAKALESGMPVAELTTFGRYWSAFTDGLSEAGRVFSGLPRLLLEGLQSYQDYVTGDAKTAAERFAEEQDRAARATAELEKTIREEARVMDAMTKATERRRWENYDWQRKGIEDVKTREANLDKFIEGYGRSNQITEAEKSGDRFAAELMRVADQINGILGMTIYSTTDVERLMGGDIRARLALNAPEQKFSEVLQQSPELTDRLRRIGAAGGDFPSQTTQVFREMRSLAQQQLDATKQVVENTKDGAVTLR